MEPTAERKEDATAMEERLELEQQMYRQMDAASGAASAGQTEPEPSAEAVNTPEVSDVPENTGTPEAAGAAENYQAPLIRILLTDNSKSGYYQESVTVSSSSAIHLEGSDLTIPAGTSETITNGDGRFMDGKIVLTPEDPSAGITVSSLQKAQGPPVYEGSLEIYLTDQGIYLVNEVNLESYLKYVVPSEMPASYAAEALKAQAVCARTYACRQIQDASLEDYHAHVDDSVSFQVYNNIARQEATDQAVDDTAGQIMTCGGEPITAYFFSTSCGYTSTNEVWSGGSSEEYLKSVYLGSDDREDVQTEEVFASFIQQKDESDLESSDGWYRWSVTLPAEVLNQRIEKYQIGTIQSFQVLKRSSGGAVSRLQVTGSQGSTTLDNEYAIRELLSVKGIAVTKNDGSVTEDMYLLPSAYFICSAVYNGSSLTGFSFLGGGYGHGVGMSQNGAAHLAEQGYGWQDILKYFYENIQLETAQA